MGSSGPMEINPATGKPWGLSVSGHHHRRHGAGAEAAHRPSRHRDAVLRHRRVDGRHAGAAMGGRPIPSACSRRCRSPRRRAIRRRTSPSTRSGARRSWPTPTGAAAIISSWACGPSAASPWRAWRRTSPISRSRRSTASSAAICRIADAVTYGFDADFQVENYLRHQGITFVERFDANSYLYITRACDYFDLAAEHGGVLANAFRGTRTRFCVISFTSDWLYPTSESRADRACAQRRRRQCELRRGRDRQGPRRLPARGAGVLRDAARLSRRLRRSIAACA